MMKGLGNAGSFLSDLLGNIPALPLRSAKLTVWQVRHCGTRLCCTRRHIGFNKISALLRTMFLLKAIADRFGIQEMLADQRSEP
jgi:hypothetical protein